MNKLISKLLFYYPVTLIKGENIGKYIAEYERFQYSSKEDISQHQLYWLKRLLYHSYENSLYYREAFDREGINLEEIRSLDDIKKLPYLTKKDLVSRFDDLAISKKSYVVSRKTTGGSTGQAVTILKNADALARERVATWRSYKWAGVSIGDPQARFWGTPLFIGQRFKYKVIDFVANRKRFSAFDINEVRLGEFYRQVLKFKPTYLYGYVSIIEVFARYVTKNKLKLPSSINSVITTSEVLSKNTRALIERSLGLKVFNEYGCGEVGSIAHECERGEMHVMDDNLILEVISGGESSEAGEIVVTDLFNYAMPLIRYKLGDYASISNTACSCGRTLKTIGNIHGRAYDCILTEDKRLFHPEFVMYIFEAIKDSKGGIEQFQVIQEKMNLLCMRIVKGSGYLDSNEKYIANEIKTKLHENMKIRFEYVDAIQREKSGKLRLIKSNLNI